MSSAWNYALTIYAPDGTALAGNLSVAVQGLNYPKSGAEANLARTSKGPVSSAEVDYYEAKGTLNVPGFVGLPVLGYSMAIPNPAIGILPVLTDVSGSTATQSVHVQYLYPAYFDGPIAGYYMVYDGENTTLYSFVGSSMMP